MKQKRVIQIETLTDIGLSVGNSVQKTEAKEKGEDCIFLLASGYYEKEDREIEIPTFISLEEARKLGMLLIDLAK